MNNCENVGKSNKVHSIDREKCPCLSRDGFLLYLLWLSAIGSYLCLSIYSPEVFSFILHGNWIENHFDVIRTDVWTVVALGKRLFLGSWLFDLLIFKIEVAGGEKGLFLLKFVIFMFFVFSLANLFSSSAKDYFVGSVFAVFISCGMLFAVDLEPKVVGWGLFALSLQLSLNCGGLSEFRRSSLLFLLSVFYSNLHPSSIFCVFVLYLLYLSKIPKFSISNLISPTAFLVGQLVNPYYGLQVLGQVRLFVNLLNVNLFTQGQAATIFYYPSAFLLLSWIILAVMISYAPRALYSVEYLITAGLALLALGSRDLTGYALFWSGYCAVSIWGRAGTHNLGNLAEAILRAKESLRKLPVSGLLWLALCLVIVNFNRSFRTPVNKGLFPQAELDFILNNNLPSPILHDSWIGSYVAYRFSDNRGEAKRLAAITPLAEQANIELTKSERKLAQLKPGWELFYNVVKPNLIICRVDSPLYYLLVRDIDWKLAFENGKEVIKSGAAGGPVMTALKTDFAWAVFVRR